MTFQKECLKFFSRNLRVVLRNMSIGFEKLQEIRLRAEQPLQIMWNGKQYFVDPRGNITHRKQDGYQIERTELLETIEYMARYSRYAFEEEIRQGFLTIQGGHRVGLAGSVVMEQGKIRTLKDISFMNIRFSHQIKGCADQILPYVASEQDVYHTLIVSPPGAGKTTLLRDLIRQISNGTASIPGRNVAVVDERSELGGCYRGILQHDLGVRTDVLDGCPKTEGLLLLLRAMNPRVLAVDEIGNEDDLCAIKRAIYCGCRMLATVHGDSFEDLKRNPGLRGVIQTQMFERYIFLSNGKNPGMVREILDENGVRLK